MSESATKNKTLLPVRIAKWYFICATLIALGFAVGRYEIFPFNLIRPVVENSEEFFAENPERKRSLVQKLSFHLQVNANQYDFVGLKVRDKQFTDPGYLLMPRFHSEYEQIVVELLRLRDNKVLYQWKPPVKEILDRSNYDNRVNSLQGFRSQHALLLPDGDLVFSSGEGALARMSKDNKLKWVIAEHFHHSIELTPKGNLIVPIWIYPPQFGPKWFKDDGYAIVTLDGEILEMRSCAQMLMDNGYRGLFLGVGVVESDRLHLNDAQPIYEDNGIAKRGDIAFSMRHISSCMLYRPSTKKIIWLKTGPWLTQHDINILDDGRYSIFGNNMYRYREMDHKLKLSGMISQVYIYDPAKNHVTEPFEEMMNKAQVYTPSGGRSRILPNGDVFIEEHDRHRLLRVSRDKIRWEYVNGFREDRSAAMHWVRYLNEDEVDLSWLEE